MVTAENAISARIYEGVILIPLKPLDCDEVFLSQG
jgi:hypothetical protein